MSFPSVDSLCNFWEVGQVHDAGTALFARSHVRVPQEVVVVVFPVLVVGLQQRCLRLLQHDVFLLGAGALSVVLADDVGDGVHRVD